MSKYGYIGKDVPTQAIKSNAGVLTPKEHRDLITDDKLLILGQLDLIQTQTVSGVTTVDFTSLGSYNIHFLTNHNLESSTTNVRWGVRFYESGVLETSTEYEWAYSQQLDSGSTSDFNDNSHSSIPIQLEQPTGAQGNAYTYFYNLVDSSKYSHISNHHNRSTGGIIAEFGMGVMKQASTVTGFQISAYDTSSAAFSGTFSLYGIKDY
tara:strand:- start:1299 stop:1922 length:624 start_codon:yes stop_codon:yes gene_type:complete